MQHIKKRGNVKIFRQSGLPKEMRKDSMKKIIKVLILSAATVLILLALSVGASAVTTESRAGRVATENSGLNVRRSASTSSEIVSSL